MLTVRQIEIIETIRTNSKLTSKLIADKLKISDRTVRSEIKYLKTLLKNIVLIEASRKLGYSIQILDKLEYEKLVYISKRKKDIKLEILELLCECALDNKEITHQEIIDKKFISLGSLKRYLKEIKKELEVKSLYIYDRNNKGIFIDGDEKRLRWLLMTYISNIYLKQRDENKYIKLKRELSILFKKRNIFLYDNFIDKAIKILLICNIRNKFQINYEEKYIKYIKNSNEFKCYYPDVLNLIRCCGLELNELDILYVIQLFMLTRKLDQSVFKDNFIDKIIYEIIIKIDEELDINFLDDKILKKWIKIHFQAMFPRIQFQQENKNNLLLNIKKEYPLAFQMAILANKVVRKIANIELNEDEIGYIAIHFSAAISRKILNNKKKIGIIVCNAGIGTALLLKEKLYREFKDFLNIVDIVPVDNINDYINDVDYIFTTTMIDEFKDNNKIIYIKDIIGNNDLEFIRSSLLRENINIEKFFCKKNFFILNVSNRNEVLKIVLGNMKKNGYINNIVEKSVFEREKISSTDIGNLIAIPHPIENNLSISNVGMCILEKPILWKEKMVQIIFFIFISKQDIKYWEPLLLSLFKFLINENGVDKIIQNKNYEYFINELKIMVRKEG